jgi:hypothetical protein
MNYGGDAADQIVRYSLEGTEVALKLTGEAAKNFAVFAAAVLRDQKKMHGKTNLTRLLRENKPLRFFEVPESRMKEFAREANVRGLLYVPVRDRSKAAGKIEFAVWAEDAAKVNRVLEKMGVDYLQADTGAKAEVGPMPAAELRYRRRSWKCRKAGSPLKSQSWTAHSTWAEILRSGRIRTCRRQKRVRPHLPRHSEALRSHSPKRAPKGFGLRATGPA